MNDVLGSNTSMAQLELKRECKNTLLTSIIVYVIKLNHRQLMVPGRFFSFFLLLNTDVLVKGEYHGTYIHQVIHSVSMCHGHCHPRRCFGPCGVGFIVLPLTFFISFYLHRYLHCRRKIWERFRGWIAGSGFVTRLILRPGRFTGGRWNSLVGRLTRQNSKYGSDMSQMGVLFFITD